MSRIPDAATTFLIHRIETLIRGTDDVPNEDQVLKDADIKSALIKAKALIEGKPLKAAPKDAREGVIHGLAKLLAAHSKDLQTKKISSTAYLLALKFIEQSVVTRREMGGHSRGYLDFLAEYIGKTGLSAEELELLESSKPS